jgi:xanthine dehydrogenase accessory factor
MSGLAELAELARRALLAGDRALLAHVVEVEGSHYRRPGARMVLTESGASAGSISAGCLEADLARRLPEVCAGARPILLEYDSRASEEVVWGLGLGCGGRVAILLTPLDEKVVSRLEQIDRRIASGSTECLETAWASGECLVEILEPPIELYICGAGSDAAALVRQGILIGWSVTLVAPRPSAAAAKRLVSLAPGGLHPPERLDGLEDRRSVAAVVMTHNFLDDLSLLRRLRRLSNCYIGVLGPGQRTERLLRELAGETPSSVSRFPWRVFSPVGLDIGAETPEEIALAVAAEIQAVFHGRSGGSLRDRPGPIHGRVETEASELSHPGPVPTGMHCFRGGNAILRS